MGSLYAAADLLAAYQPRWLADDVIAGITLAAYAIPVSLALCRSRGLAASDRHLRLLARRPGLCIARRVAAIGGRTDLLDLVDDCRHCRREPRAHAEPVARRACAFCHCASHFGRTGEFATCCGPTASGIRSAGSTDVRRSGICGRSGGWGKPNLGVDRRRYALPECPPRPCESAIRANACSSA